MDSQDSNVDLGNWIRYTASPYVVHALGSLCCILVVFWTLNYRGPLSFSSPGVFNFHPILNSLAFALIIPESILLFRFSGLKRNVTKPAHAILHFLAWLFSLFGVISAFKYHGDQNIKHLRSLHSWLGLSTFIIFTMQLAFGNFLYYYASGNVRSKFTPVHVGIGALIVFFSALTLSTGILERTNFVGACDPDISNECLVAYASAFQAIISFAALGTALSAARRNTSAASAPAVTVDAENAERLLG